MAVKTVLNVVKAGDSNNDNPQTDTSGTHAIKLSLTNTTSHVISALNIPKRLVAWNIEPGDKVHVNIVRLGNTGNDGWTRSDDCCVGPTPPGDVVIMGRMPYARCGVNVVLTDQSPTAVIDDTGNYLLVYESTRGDSCLVEVYDDYITRKTC